MMANTQKTWRLLTAFASMLSCLAGCSVLIESDKKQCTKDSQCVQPYVCDTKQGICKQETGCVVGEPCTRSDAICIEATKTCELADCKKSGECESNELCDTEANTCVSTALASCEETADCKKFDGAPICSKIDNRCTGAECESTAECMKASPTAECKMGACVDPTWGCLGVEDVRKAEIMTIDASLQVKVLYAYMAQGQSETGVRDLVVRVCSFADIPCDDDSKLAVKASDLTYEDNTLTIRGLKRGLNYRVLLQANHPSKDGVAMLPTEYIMYRTVVGDTVEPKPILMFEDAVRDSLSGATGVNLDKNLGFVLMRIFDCTDTEVAGVQVGISSSVTGNCMGCSTGIFYQNVTNIPDPTATATNAAGRAGIVNVKTDGLSRITLTRAADNKKITSFTITPRAGWLTYVHFWPWDYGTAAD